MSNRLEKVAYHEAGHAVRAYMLAIPFEYVTIVPNGSSYGHIRPERSWKRATRPLYDPDTSLTPTLRDKLERAIIYELAGPLAQKLFEGKTLKRPRWNWSTDLEKVAYKVLNCYDEGPATAYLNYVFVLARHQVEADFRRGSIQKVAKALLDRKTLAWADVDTVLLFGGEPALTGR